MRLSFFAFALLVGCAPAERPNEARSVLLIYVDTLRADHLGAYGYDQPTSPNLDAFAANGVRFSQARSASSWTFSSTASLVTGLLASAHGALAPGVVKNEATNHAVSPLAPGFQTLAERLAAAGFQTALFSRNGYLTHGNEQGFQTVHNAKKSPADEQTRLALAWIAALPSDARFFLTVHYMDVHVPNRPTAASRKLIPAMSGVSTEERKQAAKYHPHVGTDDDPDREAHRAQHRAVYDASIRDVDTAVSALLAGLGDRRRDTVVVFTADHGESLWDHTEMEASLYADPRAFRGAGHGQGFFEEVVHVPLVISLPGVIAPGVVATHVSLVDVLPTLLDVLALPAPSGLDGRSLLPALRGEVMPNRPNVFEGVCFGREKEGILDGNWKFVQSDAEPDLLLDLETDPGETTNLAPTHPEEVARLRTELAAARATSAAHGEGIRPAVATPDTPGPAELEELKELGYAE